MKVKTLLGVSLSLLLVFLVFGSFSTTSFAAQGTVSKDIAVVNTNPPQDFNVSIRLNKEVGSVYKPGEEVKIFITATKDCYIRVWDIGTSGKVTLLYPYKKGQTDFIKAGTTLAIPGPDARYIVNGPEGTEYVQVIASLTPMKGMPAPKGNQLFPTVSKDPKKFTKDIQVQLNQVPNDKWISASTWFAIKNPVTLGTLFITTTPPGATVRVDNVDYGQAVQPLRIPVPQGNHIVTAYLPGYQVATKVVAVPGGKEVPVVLTLIQPKGYISITSIDNEIIGARVFIDGYEKGIVDSIPKVIEVNTNKKLHEVVVIKPGYYAASQKVISPKPGETTDVVLKMEKVY